MLISLDLVCINGAIIVLFLDEEVSLSKRLV